MTNYSTRNGWELDHTGGGNYSFIRDFTTLDGKTGNGICK
jgi:hypothetical protein